MAKLADAPGLGPGGSLRGGSSPSNRTNLLGVAQLCRVLHLECRGRWFKSSHPDQNPFRGKGLRTRINHVLSMTVNCSSYRGISSSGRASALQAEGDRFESDILHQNPLLLLHDLIWNCVHIIFRMLKPEIPKRHSASLVPFFRWVIWVN